MRLKEHRFIMYNDIKNLVRKDTGQPTPQPEPEFKDDELEFTSEQQACYVGDELNVEAGYYNGDELELI